MRVVASLRDVLRLVEDRAPDAVWSAGGLQCDSAGAALLLHQRERAVGTPSVLVEQMPGGLLVRWLLPDGQPGPVMWRITHAEATWDHLEALGG